MREVRGLLGDLEDGEQLSAHGPDFRCGRHAVGAKFLPAPGVVLDCAHEPGELGRIGRLLAGTSPDDSRCGEQADRESPKEWSHTCNAETGGETAQRAWAASRA
jgi:hypothetical protein